MLDWFTHHIYNPSLIFKIKLETLSNMPHENLFSSMGDKISIYKRINSLLTKENRQEEKVMCPFIDNTMTWPTC